MPIKRSVALERDLVRLAAAPNIKDKLNGRTLISRCDSRDMRIHSGANHELYG